MGSDYAYGVLRDARYSSNSVEFIGCSVRSNDLATCYAKDANGTYKSCSTTDAGVRDVLKAISANSYLYVRFDNGECSYAQVYNTSIYVD